VSVKAAHGVPWEHGKVGGLFYLFRRESTFHLCCVPEMYRDPLQHTFSSHGYCRHV
jgi:hypothetical protein